jgi:hypothetical protein
MTYQNCVELANFFRESNVNISPDDLAKTFGLPTRNYPSIRYKKNEVLRKVMMYCDPKGRFFHRALQLFRHSAANQQDVLSLIEFSVIARNQKYFDYAIHRYVRFCHLFEEFRPLFEYEYFMSEELRDFYFEKMVEVIDIPHRLDMIIHSQYVQKNGDIHKLASNKKQCLQETPISGVTPV